MELKQKVFAYITCGQRLLVLNMVDYPHVGTQVPAGTRPVEEPADLAVMREAVEETGLENLSLLGFLGELDFKVPDRDEVHRRRFYHLHCPGSPEARWRHYEMHPSEGDVDRVLFELFWVDFPEGVPELALGHDAMLAELRRRLDNHPE